MTQSSRYADIKEDGSRYVDLEDFEQGFDREHVTVRLLGQIVLALCYLTLD